MKKIIIWSSIFLIIVTIISAQQTNIFPTNATVGIGTGSPNATTAMHIYRNTTSSVPILWLDDDNATGYTQMVFLATSSIFTWVFEMPRQRHLTKTSFLLWMRTSAGAG
jgi:hypothetical protein